MDSRDRKDSGGKDVSTDTDKPVQVSTQKKLPKKVLIWLVILVVAIAAAAAGFYYYKTAVLDKQDAEKTVNTQPPKSPQPKKLSPEEQMTAALTDGIKKEMEELKKNDDTTAIKNSTQAAISVGGDLDEEELKKYE